ncbi:MAG TPA: POTRA domain-containing protein [Candidatus Dormibacteraeota bacterium]|nr:POTRA domain-containing protein [Candidatus Dormibacteraeota bacterium]
MPRAVRVCPPVFAAILALAVPLTIIRGAVPLAAPDGQVATSAQEASPGPTPAGAAPPGPAPSPTPAPPAEAAPSPQDKNRGPETGPQSPEPGPGGEPEGATAPEAPAGGGKGVIGRIVVDGNIRVSDTAFFNSLHLKSGDPYDERAIQDEFRRLWDLDLFDDINVESRKREGNVYDLIFHVRDRPLVGNVAFVGMKAVTEANIQERLNQAKCEVKRGQPVDFSVLSRAEAAIEQLLAEKGYLQARAKARLTPVGQGQREVTFHIREGAKTKIKKIDFTGNTMFTDRRLRKMLKLTKQAFWLTSWASSKTLYHPAKFDQDAENIRTSYKSVGYLDIAIQPEIVELVGGKPKKPQGTPKSLTLVAPGTTPGAQGLEDEDEEDFEEPPPAPAPPGETEKQRTRRVKAELKAKKKSETPPKKWVHLTVPIDEGAQYKVGKIDIEGNSVFSGPEVMARVPLRAGMVFNDSALKFGTKRLEEDYGERGYFYVSIDPRIDKHERTADLTLAITEDKKYFVDRIEFGGNTTTRDGVLRREMPLTEEDLFNVRRMRLGLRKIAQLGYFQVGDDPAVKPKGETDHVDILVQGVESSRNEIQVGGGVSGLEGGFFQASYSTRNFLGRGEIFSTYVQTGTRANRYSFNFTEPWFLGHPWTLGFSLFRRQTDYTGFRQIGSGGTLSLGRLLGVFSRFDVAYGYENVDLLTTTAGFPVNRQNSATSSLTTLYTVDTRNNYFRPTRGYRVQGSMEYAGGFLGGDNFFYKPRFDATLYLPGLSRKHYIGLNAAYGYVSPFGGRVVPVFERYFLGGERSLRVFKSRTVSPARRDVDVNHNGFIDTPEDRNPDGVFEPCEDLNGNGVQDKNEPDRGNCLLDPAEDANNNGILDTEDLNHNGVLDPGEDKNGNGILDTEDRNGNGRLDLGEDRPDGIWTPFCPADDPNMNGKQDPGEFDNGNCRLDPGEDTNGDGVFGTVFPGGNQYILLNAEYTVPLADAVEFALFYDAGNAFDDGQKIRLNDMRVDYGFELRFYLPVFQAPLRLIYGFIQNPQKGEDPSNFIFSIGTTF